MAQNYKWPLMPGRRICSSCRRQEGVGVSWADEWHNKSGILGRLLWWKDG